MKYGTYFKLYNKPTWLFILLVSCCVMTVAPYDAHCQQANKKTVNLSDEDQRDITEQAQQKVNFIMGQIKNLASQPGPESGAFRRQEEYRKKKVVQSILTNFADADSNTVQVTDREKQKHTLTARTYFNNLSTLGRKYTTIEVTTVQKYIGEIVQVGPDNYVVTGVFCQTFSGTNATNEKRSFSDFTCKNITLHVTRDTVREPDEHGNIKEKNKWLVRIGDITINDQQ